MAEEILSTEAPTAPGIYIGKIFRNQATGLTGYQRRPSIVVKGNRLSTRINILLRRSYITNRPITFTSVSPNLAFLAFPAVPDQTIATLSNVSAGTTVASSKWSFVETVPSSGVYDQILILPEAFDSYASYTISYQSTDRTIRDALPFTELREMMYVGDVENQAKYIERVNYFIPVDITDPEAGDANANSAETDHSFTAIVADGGNTGTCVPAINGSQAPLDHNYNRLYRLEVMSVVGPTVTVRLYATQNSGGLASRAQVPLHPSLASPLYPAGMIDTATTATTNTLSFTDPEIGESIDIDWDLTAATSVVGDEYTFTALGHSFIEVDSAISNTNQWPAWSAVTPGGTNTGTGVVTVRADSEFSGTSDRSYRLITSAVAGVSPNRTATFLWAGWGELPYTTGTFSISESTGTNALVEFDEDQRLALAFGVTHFAVGDTFSFTTQAPRKIISAKDSREYNLEVTTAVAGAVDVFWRTNTPEGRFDTAVITGPEGSMRLPGDVDLWLRNIGTTSGQNRYVANDTWSWQTTDEEVMDWSLTSRTTETIQVSDVLTDVLGTVTGTVGTPFVLLTNLPTSLIYVRDSQTGSLVTTATLVSGKAAVALAAVPANALEIRYEYIGAEPAPANTYYVTANVLRPLSAYDTPILYTDFDESAAPALGPASTTNDALIAAELMLKDNNAPGIYVIQVRDSDGDGVYTTEDYVRGINKALSVSQNTDLIVINKAETLSAQFNANTEGNNPFRNHYNFALWVGMPLGSSIGDIDTPGTVTYMAKRTMQLPLQSQARGTRILVSNWEATKNILLADGSSVSVVLDGSFVAAALAAKNASFTNPNTLLLNQLVNGFTSMKTFDEDETLALVSCSAVYIYNDGTDQVPVFKCGEGLTVDASDDSLHEINVAINVRTFTQADMKSHLTQSVIGIVPDSAAAGVAAYRTQIALRLSSWITDGITGEYEDAEGNTRTLDPQADIKVFRNPTKKTQYYFKYAWFGKYGSTRGYGLYAVDISNFGQPLVG